MTVTFNSCRWDEKVTFAWIHASAFSFKFWTAAELSLVINLFRVSMAQNIIYLELGVTLLSYSSQWISYKWLNGETLGNFSSATWMEAASSWWPYLSPASPNGPGLQRCWLFPLDTSPNLITCLQPPMQPFVLSKRLSHITERLRSC